MSNEIRIENVGPVQSLRLPIPEGGGVVVLIGKNGSGKTQSLEAVESLIRGRGKLSVRDGQKRGEVDGFGARISVSANTRRTGELEVVSLEGRLSLAELVDPQMVDPVASDGKRIKALVSLSGATADPAKFYPLVGDKDLFDELVTDQEAEDLPTLAAKVKRQLESEARKREQQAERLMHEATGLQAGVQGVDVSVESDGTKLQSALVKAIQHEATARQRVKEHDAAVERATKAKEDLERAKAAYKGPALDKCMRAAMSRKDEHQVAFTAVTTARLQLAAAEEAERNCRAAWESAVAAEEAAAQAETLIASLTKQIGTATEVVEIDPEEVAQASLAVQTARQAVEIGAVARRAKEQLEQIEAKRKTAREQSEMGMLLREAARGTDQILSDAVASEVLRVEAGRLVLTTGRGTTYYGELSDGERWSLALDIAADRVGEHGVIVVPQDAWQDLDAAGRKRIAQKARERKVTILTAEADTEHEGTELHAEVFTGA